LKKDKILLVRSASFGDFFVILPQLFYLIKTGKISLESIHFLIINRNGVNPVDIIFGKDNFFSKNTFVIKGTNFFSVIFNLFIIRRKIGSVQSIYYLNFTLEKFVNKFIKTKLLSLFWFDAKKVGFSIKKKYSKSHYFSPFPNITIEDSFSFNPGFYNWYFSIANVNYKFDENFDFIVNHESYIAFYCNSNVSAKIWPQSNYIELIKRVANNYADLDIILIGGGEDFEYNQNIISALDLTNKETKVINLAGSVEIPSLVKILKNAKAFVTNDGFPMHIASIANCPTIGIFTYREEIGAWDPICLDYFHSYRCDVGCKECYSRICNDPVCIQKVDVNVIYSELNLVLSNNSNKGRFASLLYPYQFNVLEKNSII
jgi:ADP-heptose:LPS heptosyltransferase